MTADEIRRKYIEFFVSKGHKEIAPASLLPENDPTTLFTSSGMQPLVPYLLGQEHQAGKRLVNSQPCFRAEDIEEVGDNRHTTFFEMLGNWSLGDYFKKEQLPWIWEFLTKVLELPKEKLHVTFFEGNGDVPRDTETYDIWKGLGLDESHIRGYGVNKNWWSRSGSPEKMPTGEIGGPDSEVFYEFSEVEHDPKFGNECHPNCDCGRFLEIGNSVFIQYQKQEDGSLKELEQKNVDFGGGLERLVAALNNDPDVFSIDIFEGAKKVLEDVDVANSQDSQRGIRIMLDHIRASIFIIGAGIEPSNKGQGYVLRRLIRRFALYARLANIDVDSSLPLVTGEFMGVYTNAYPNLIQSKGKINETIESELDKFNKTLNLGLRKIAAKQKGSVMSGGEMFDFYQTYGFPPELIEEFAKDNKLTINKKGFDEAMGKHQELSRTASAGKFAGGLADHSQETIRGHTATHLLHQALRDVLGDSVHQTGSNITPERIRFDFAFGRKLTDEELEKVENIINEKVKENLPVRFEMMTLEDAKKTGAIGLFDEKYADQVKVYFVGNYSAEFCGGPHVEHTSQVGSVKITKETAAGAGSRRVYMELQNEIA